MWDGEEKCIYYYTFIERIDWSWVSEVGNASDIPWLPRNVKCYLQLNWDKNLFLVLCWTMGCLYHQVFTCLTSFSSKVSYISKHSVTWCSSVVTSAVSPCHVCHLSVHCNVLLWLKVINSITTFHNFIYIHCWHTTYGTHGKWMLYVIFGCWNELIDNSDKTQ